MMIKLIGVIHDPIFHTTSNSFIEWDICIAFANLIEYQFPIFRNINLPRHERI